MTFNKEPSMTQFDITKFNIAVDRLLDVTENPRHRYLLEAYNRHATWSWPGVTRRSSTPR